MSRRRSLRSLSTTVLLVSLITVTCTPAARHALVQPEGRGDAVAVAVAASVTSPSAAPRLSTAAMEQSGEATDSPVELVDHGDVGEGTPSASPEPAIGLAFTSIPPPLSQIQPLSTPWIPTFRVLRDQRWRIGLKTGARYDDVADQSEFHWRPRAAAAAVFIARRVTDALEAHVEVSGRRTVGRSVVGSSELVLRAEDWTIPIVARYTLPGPRWSRPFALAGPAITLQRRCTLRFETSGLVSGSSCASASSAYRPWSIGLDAGAGIEAGTGPTIATIEVRAFADPWRDDIPAVAGRQSASWSVLLGFSTPLGWR